MPSSYENFDMYFKVLRDFLNQKINQTYHPSYNYLLPVDSTINAKVLEFLEKVLYHRYLVQVRHNKDLTKVLERMETLIKTWGNDGGEDKAQLKKLKKLAEKMERANLKGWSSTKG